MTHLVLISLHADPATPSGVGGGGGTHAYVRELIVGLGRSGSRVTVLTRWAHPELPEEECLGANVRIIRLRIGPLAPLDKRSLNELHTTSLSAASRALRISQVDLLHSIYWNSGLVALDLSCTLKCPFVHTVISNGWRRLHEGARDQPPDRIHVEKRVFKAAFAIFCVSGEEQMDLIRRYDVEARKTIIVGRPVSSVFRHPCHDELGRPLVPHYGL